MQNLVSHADYFGFEFPDVDNIDLFREALQNPCYLYIDLNNGHIYNRRFNENHSPEVRIGARLAVASGLSDVPLVDMIDKYPIELFSIRNVVHEIFKHRFEAHNRALDVLIIHIDEYQVYINDAQTPKRPWSKAREFFKDMLKAIGGIMRADIAIDGHPNKRYFVVPICTGTSAIGEHFLPTDHRKRMIALKPLEYTSAKEMFRDKYEYSRQTTYEKRAAVEQSIRRRYDRSLSDSIETFSTKLCNKILELPHVDIALRDTGFIPKFVDDFLQPSEPAVNYDWGGALFERMVERFMVQIGDAPGCWRSHKDIHVIISLGLTRLAVT